MRSVISTRSDNYPEGTNELEKLIGPGYVVVRKGQEVWAIGPYAEANVIYYIDHGHVSQSEIEAKLKDHEMTLWERLEKRNK